MYCKAKKIRRDSKIEKLYFFGIYKVNLGLKGGISIDADSEPPRYVLWCCGGICHQLLTFFQIGSGHTVSKNATKIDTYLVNVKSTVKIFSIFVAFLENMNFMTSDQFL